MSATDGRGVTIMGLTGRLDPEIAAVFPHLPVLDLADILTACGL
jgi:hypothetical protein